MASDSRFASFRSDPRYRPPRRRDNVVKIDKRFKSMLEDEGDFARKAKVDRYGRVRDTGGKTSSKKALHRLYEIASDESGADDDAVQSELERISKGEPVEDDAKYTGFGESSSSEGESSSEDQDSDDSSSEEDESEGEQDAAVEAGLSGFAADEDGLTSVPEGEVTTRIAVVNIDWDHLQSVDLMAVAQSFCPVSGKVESVAVYPSEFGKQRMERERFEGPPKELFSRRAGPKAAEPDEQSPDPDDSDEDDTAIEARLLKHAADPTPEVDRRALRAYQLSRLRYYYAVVTCDSLATARNLYDNMDGREYLSTANFFDLRFVPDDVGFDGDVPRDVCTRVPGGYKPADFVTDALTHSNVRLTWDEEDRRRKDAQKRAFARGRDGKPAADLEADDDLQAYIGSDSSGDGVSEDNGLYTVGQEVLGARPEQAESKQRQAGDARAKLRAALGLANDDAAPRRKKDAPVVGDMQITFSSALGGGTSDKPSVFANRPEDVHEETTAERYIRKERERRQRRKDKGRHAAGETGNGAEPEDGAPVDAEAANADADLGFDDPFFEEPQKANAQAKAEGKRQRREAKRAETEAAAARDAAQRAELEQVMRGDDAPAHGADFDMAAILKAEKLAKKQAKLKKKKRAQVSDAAAAAPPDIDVADARFARVHDSAEYAIDPTFAKFSGTAAMRRLVEQGREVRARRAGDDEGDEDEHEAGQHAPKHKKRRRQ